MKISIKRQVKLYDAISEEIIQSRIHFSKQPSVTGVDVEKHMFYLTNRIWANVEKVLGLREQEKEK